MTGMPSLYDNGVWAMEIAPGWEAYVEDNVQTCVPETDDAALQLSAAGSPTAKVTPEDLKPIAAGYGLTSVSEFSTRDGVRGLHGETTEDGTIWRYWFLGRGGLILLITYNCDEQTGHRDREACAAMVESIRISED